MTEEELLIFNKDVRKARIAFIIIFLVLITVVLSVQKCTNDKYNQLKGEHKELNKEYKKQKDGVAVFQKYRIIEKDSLNKEIFKREVYNDSLVANNEQLQEKINTIKKRKSSISIPKTDPCYEIAVKAEEGEKCAEIIPLKDQQLENKDEQISNLEQDKTDIKKELATSEEENVKIQSLNSSAEENINNLKSQVRSLNTKNTINKILIPAAAIIGAGIGYKLAK